MQKGKDSGKWWLVVVMMQKGGRHEMLGMVKVGKLAGLIRGPKKTMD